MERMRMKMRIGFQLTSSGASLVAQHLSMYFTGINSFNPLWLLFVILSSHLAEDLAKKKLIWGYISLGLCRYIYVIHSPHFHPGTGMAPRTTGVIIQRHRARGHIVQRMNPAVPSNESMETVVENQKHVIKKFFQLSDV